MRFNRLVRTDHLLGILACVSAAVWGAWLARSETSTISASAQLMPLEYKVASTETSRIASVLVAAGQRVREGETLASLDTTLLAHEIHIAEARRRLLQAEPAAAAAALDADGFAVERSFQGELSQARAELAAALQSQAAQAAELSSLQQEIARQRKLVKDGLVRAVRAEELEVQTRTLTQTLASWPARIDAIRTRQAVAEQALSQWRSDYRTATAPEAKDTRLRPLRDRIAEQDKAINLLKARLAASVIRAPADGEVISLLARAGDVATAGVPFIVLHGTGARNLVAYVSERAHLRPGTPAVARRRGVPVVEWPTRVLRTGDAVVPLPARFWLYPAAPLWGREVFLEVPAGARLDNGEAVDVRFYVNANEQAGGL